MGWVEMLALCFLAGLTASGVAATLFSSPRAGELRFTKPFVSPDHLPRSIGIALLAGPFMLGNDALNARRDDLISGPTLGACGLAAGLWALGWGAAVLALAAALIAWLA